MSQRGALSGPKIHELRDAGMLLGVVSENVRPGSVDLALSDEGYRVDGAFLPRAGESVEEAFKRVGAHKLTGEKKLLERGTCYVFRLREGIAGLPRGVYAYCNPKSSTGRVDTHVRVLADGVSRYDYVPEGYKGPLWLLVAPKAFPIIVSEGLTLSQVRICNADTRFTELDLEVQFSKDRGLLYNTVGNRFAYKDLKHSDRDGSILLTLGLNAFERPGFEALENGEPIDLSLKGHYDPDRFFRPINLVGNGGARSLHLRADTFYILSSGECVLVPPGLACEMRPMDERSGDLRSHYAGFIDPGWGFGKSNDGKGRPLTLEVRSFDANIIVVDGQPIAKIRFEHMVEEPPEHYDQMAPTYGGQIGPQLGKHFKPWVV